VQPDWLTAPETFAAANTNKELKNMSQIAANAHGATILMVNGSLMADWRLWAP
jgi:hypothetical protein